ncbi:hypothetical protein BDQ12DRAFT_670986 [Crucibulum laeve]|uniref:Uncharacterized protein n=1 Tax=Crucibulum laeve TaxID=68775 RepID=A0A5C3LIG3_9AGAR|nr:hypothetical protein BDQ12DRAFT_670986 [Crucibulum laeve]
MAALVSLDGSKLFASLNVLQMKFMNEARVVSVTNFLPGSIRGNPLGGPSSRKLVHDPSISWSAFVCTSAFNSAQDSNITGIVIDDSISFDPPQKKVLFESTTLTLDLHSVFETYNGYTQNLPVINLETLGLSENEHQGSASQVLLELTEGQSASLSPAGESITIQHTQGRARKTQVELVGSAHAKLIFSSDTRHLPRVKALDDPFLTKVLSLTWSGESDECKNRPPPTPVKRPDGPHEKPRPYRNLYFLRSHVKKFEAKHHIPENVSKQLDQAVDDLESKKITPVQVLLKAREILHDYLKNNKAGKHSLQRDVEVGSGLSEDDEFEAMLEE